MKRILLLCTCISLLILAAGFGGCSKSDNNAPATAANNFSLTFASPKAATGAAKAIAPDTVTAGADTLIMTSLQLVLRKIELQACSDTSGSDSLRVEEFEAGPMLVDMPLGGAISQVLAVDVAPGTYGEVEFNIHAVRGDDSTAVAFRTEHPDFVGVSIRADGTFNGTPFSFTTRMGAHQETRIDPALVVGDGSGPINLTLSVDNTSWFFTPDSTLVDPSTANWGGPNQWLVEHNIRRSFHAFEDRDHDGRDDHHGGGGGDGDGGGPHHPGGMGH